MENQQQMTPEQYQAWAHNEWLCGRYCIGCQAVGVSTNWAGYCDTCLAGFAEREKEREAQDEVKRD